LSALETSGEIKKGMDTQFVMSFNCFSISIRGNSWSAHLRVCPSLPPPPLLAGYNIGEKKLFTAARN
jgi:hypothetical protein